MAGSVRTAYAEAPVTPQMALDAGAKSDLDSFLLFKGMVGLTVAEYRAQGSDYQDGMASSSAAPDDLALLSPVSLV